MREFDTKLKLYTQDLELSLDLNGILIWKKFKRLLIENMLLVLMNEKGTFMMFTNILKIRSVTAKTETYQKLYAGKLLK